MFVKLTAVILSAIGIVCMVLGVPFYATGSPLDMENLTLVWSDEFDGDHVDESVWSGHYVWGGTEIRRGGYWNKKMATVSDGCLTIRTEYLEDGLDGGPAGYYSYGMDTRNSFEQLYGYFETRCILPRGYDLWGAFWMLCDGMYDETDRGVNGAELDIFESLYFSSKRPNTVSSNIHIDGYGDAHRAHGSQRFLLHGDPYAEFNTYGMEWTPDGYTFYINGQKSFSTNWGGVSAVPEWLILSVETGGKDGVPSCDFLSGIDKSEFIVDYVRAYTRNSAAERTETAE